MSQENVEIVRQAVEAFNHRDVKGLQARCAPRFELVPIRSALEATVYSGPDAIAKAFREFDESWEGLRFDVETLHPGHDSVVAIAQMRGWGRQSGVEVNSRMGLLFELEDGQVTLMRAFSAASEALEAAGLSE